MNVYKVSYRGKSAGGSLMFGEANVIAVDFGSAETLFKSTPIDKPVYFGEITCIMDIGPAILYESMTKAYEEAEKQEQTQKPPTT